MDYRLNITPRAKKELDKLPKEISRRILAKLNEAMVAGNVLARAKALSDYSIPTYRFRIGDYRVIFRKEEQTEEWVLLVIVKVGHRKEVYKKLDNS